METRGIETERGEQNRLINSLTRNNDFRTELRNSGLTEPARRVADLRISCFLTTQLRTRHHDIEALPKDSNAA